MKTGRKVHIKGIGNVSFLKKNTIKRLRISVKPMEGVTVHVPAFVSYDEALNFVLSKERWLKSSLKKVSQINSQLTVFLPGKDYNTYDHHIKIYLHKDQHVNISRKEQSVYIFIPSSWDVCSKVCQDAIRDIITEIYRSEAKKHLPLRVAQLASLHGFEYKKVFIKNTRTRWGSCSAVNNINLSLHLMRLPKHLADYIILHELVHTVYKNHGEKFWRYLKLITQGKVSLYEKELRNYSSTVW